MRQTTIWEFLPQESSIEAKPTNQRNTMNFESLDDLIEFLQTNQINRFKNSYLFFNSWHI